ncbi:MAG: DNA-binding transcriptional LysR family regulator, partial [Patiriisocius sp.]
MATQPAVELWATDLGNAAALLENDGIDVAVIDGVALNLSDADYESRILEFNPDVIVVEPNSAVVDDVLKQITRIRAK